MLNPKAEISEKRYFGSISASVSPLKNLFPKSKQNMNFRSGAKYRSNSENIAPPDPNIQISDTPESGPVTFPKKLARKPVIKSQKVENATSVLEEKVLEAPDAAVKVVVRLRPAGGGQQTVRKFSSNTVSVGDRKFTFDSVFDSTSTQDEIYQLVGAPLVKDALAGYNISILAYGQTGSGKSYTMWGPPSAMVGGASANGLQGIVPRIFQSLFNEIQKKQENSDGKQINHQCRCSFLEIYNEKIGDLLDPTQRNLEIIDDAKNGFYVENLTEEYVSSYEDVTQLLVKGLSNRKIGATSINSKSSRSHILFTFIIESWCKDSSSKCFGSSNTSRISMIDLAGFEKIVLDDASKHHLKEEKYIKKSMSQLGHLVNILTESSSFGKADDFPRRSSCVTHLLRESFGGNAKLSVLCAISPDNRSNGETISMLRFGQRVKLVKNEPVINEIAEDDVDDLSNQIRQLKEELIKAKSNPSNSFNSSQGYFRARSVRESVNQLRLSLNRSLISPHVDNGLEKEICAKEDDVEELRLQIDNLHNLQEANLQNTDTKQLYSAEGRETDQAYEHYLSCSEESECEEISSRGPQTEFPDLNTPSAGDPDSILKKSMAVDPPLRSSLSISKCQSAFLQDPVFSESPKISTQRRSKVFSSNHLSNQDVMTSKNLGLVQGEQQADHIKSSLRSSRKFPGSTESLATSLHKGLQIIDHHRRNSASTRSLASFSFEHLALEPYPSTEKAKLQTSLYDEQSTDSSFVSFVCTKCLGRENSGSNEDKGIANSRMIPVEGSGNFSRFASEVTKLDVEKELDIAIKREEELHSICKQQAAKIEHLKQLLEQCNCGTQNNSIKEHKVEKCESPINENKLLTWNGCENYKPEECTKDECEIKEVQEELNDGTEKEPFDKEEREALLKENEILRSKLQSYTAASTNKSVDRFRSSLLSQSMQLRSSSAHARGNSEEEIEKERQMWMELESDWISLTDELRIKIETNRQRAERVEMELKLEKKCTEELDDALRRAVIGQARMVEHYTELQEKYDDLSGKHQTIMEGIADVKRAAAKAGARGCGSRFAKSIAVELSAMRMERERERKLLKKENQSLKLQLRDTAEAVHAAGELLARLREAEEATLKAEEKNTLIQEENDKLKSQIEKLKKKHKMEIATMKQYLAESRLPQAALQPLYREDTDEIDQRTTPILDDDQSWRVEFGAIYQEHHY